MFLPFPRLDPVVAYSGLLRCRGLVVVVRAVPVSSRLVPFVGLSLVDCSLRTLVCILPMTSIDGDSGIGGVWGLGMEVL